MLTWLAQLILVLTSIAPIAFVYAASVWTRNREFALYLAISVTVLVICCDALLRQAKKQVEQEPKTVIEVTGLEKEPLAFLVAYALPVIATAAKPTANGELFGMAFAILAFVLVMGLLVWQQQLYYVNPVVALLGYHFHSAKCEAGERVLIVSRRKMLSVKQPLTVAVLSDYLWLDVT